MDNTCLKLKVDLGNILFYCFLLLLTFFGNNSLFAQKQYTIPKLEKVININGIISPSEWGDVDSITGFIQLEPEKGIESTETTIVYSFYDNDNLYFVFKCNQKKAVVANVQNRDKVEKSDDAVKIIIDSYYDNRSGYGFVVNPINTQTDFRIDDDGRNINEEWDEEWKSATRIYSWGWIAEIAIPFNSIKYKSSSDKWGINFGRIIRHNYETSWWSGELNADYRISQNAIMKGIIPPARNTKIVITPYSSLRYEDSDVTGNYKNFIPGAGVDLKFKPNTNLNLDATIYPDFASVEGDEEKIDLSGWEEGFPEKRLFFQEGNEMFDMRYKLFYSRRVGDLIYGGKFAGKVGDYSMNILHSRSIENDSLGIPAAYYSAARVKKDILKSSSIGAIFVDKTTDTSYVRSYGLDWVLNPGTNWKITGQLIGSSPGNFAENSAGFIRGAHESNKHHIHVRYSDLGKSFKDNVNQTGFIRDDDRRELDSDLEYTFWFKTGVIKYIEIASMNNAYWDHSGFFKSSKFRESLKLHLKNKFSLDLYNENEKRLVDAKTLINEDISIWFRNSLFSSTVGYNTDESSYAKIKYILGENFGRNMQIIQGDMSFNPLKKLTIKYSVAKLKFDPEELEDLILRLEHSTVLNIFSVNYYFTNNLWVRVFAQNDTYKERTYLYGQFGWRFKPPFGALYFIYAGDDYFNYSDDMYYNSQTAFFKLTYPISF